VIVLLNCQGLSRRTVEMHRARMLERLGARTSAEAAKIVQAAQAEGGTPRTTNRLTRRDSKESPA
jgi:hypothetical protein